MIADEPLPSDVQSALESIYEEMMWLSGRPNVTASRARAWYTHVMAESLKRSVRRFSGFASLAVVEAGEEPLMLEHFQRIQTTLTALVNRHREHGIADASEFVNTIVEHEQVHIVTRGENYAAMRSKGDYVSAGIVLVPWASIAGERRHELWKRMLRGRVSNAGAFKP